MNFAHTALSVVNLEASRKFYETVFNLKFHSAWERKELQAHAVQLSDENGRIVELVQHDSPLPLAENLMDFQKAGIKHIAFAVDNIEMVLERALASGAKSIWSVKKGISVKRVAFIADPDGIPIELVEL